ncbi:DUF3570 domain-containing protein [Rheinheimera baltica]|uniref:DUF3570 domain-containing protein n=1 Tax=Rheinheimera baltica TaxID=67576 RepID=A0ABT9HVX4_9GAMM|nr:DUF3570 domain-containing protein [Rheinheimera baltica]MDP5135284.1 DUF3570 domain-containing protein [Rheinheimera baltica]MDP5143959.1 DUF3570 domain-containing protein [Rheinheimera baltica]MDP5151619.1 DUF3570 domain-containing protein [Rheinheimera baltica]MDP5191745.1 DUF3570 domain-containing protein [Rheinheimera baltica]
MVVTRLLTLFILFCSVAQAAVLPQDRADLMYHAYQGGGVSIDGPAVMLRKKAGQSVSLSAYYYVDTVSGASVDVQATASAYTEEREEKRVGIDYLAGNSIVSLNYAQSDENDYNAKSVSFAIAHDTFGGMTTLSLEAGLGDDEVGRNGDESFSESLKRYNYKLGWTQVLTDRWIAALNVQVDLDEGFLNNPYRSVRYLNTNESRGYSYQAEVYPNTRNTVAIALVNKFYLPYRAAVSVNLRHYQDSWDIRAFDAEVEYVHPLSQQWVLEAKMRWYSQGQANFYRDLFDYANQQNFMARDKELSEFNNITLGLGASYMLPVWGAWPEAKPELTLQWDHIRFNYKNFRNVTVVDASAGLEPLYRLEANVIRAFFSLYF